MIRRLAIVVLLAGCGSGEDPERDEAAALELRAARDKLRRRALDAYGAFRAIPADTRAGRRAREDLARADVLYREGIRLAEAEREAEAGDRLARAVRIAPIDPRLYRRLGDVYMRRYERTRSWADYQRGMEYFRKAVDALAATPAPAPDAVARGPGARSLAAVLAALVAIAAGVLLLHRVRRGETLEELIEKSPEMHPQVAYQVGALRHELLKHRIGAVSDALSALRVGRSSLPEIAYLAGRLFGGEPIARVWETHVDALERASGGRLNLRWRDRRFRRAGRALREIGRLRRDFARPDERLARRLGDLHAQVQQFDAWLRELADRLTLAKVDAALLREVVYAVQQEHQAGAVHVDEIRYGDVPPDVHVEVFRTDLVIVLKNVVRNAILAMADEAPGRALGLEVRLEPEPTGEESVTVVVRDTSAQTLTTEAIYERKLDRGLGLVTAALDRYNGSISVEPSTGGFRKAVALRFFRAMRDGA